jgi:hypothetical protein
MRMGPGFLPRALSWGLVGIGAFLTIRALLMSGPSIERSLVRPQVFIIIAILTFAFLIDRPFIGGLAPAVLAATVLASLASREMNWKETAILAVGMAIASVILFIYLLGQSMEVWSRY